VQVFRDQMEQIGKQDWIAGALMWCYQDYKSHRNLWPGLTEGIVDHGVVDENRQRRPSYQVWQSLNSPAHLQMKWNFNPESRPAGFAVTISRRDPDEIPSYALRGYRVSWELRDRDNNKLAGGERDLPEIGAPQTLDARWPVPASPSLHLTFRLFRPTGFVAGEQTLDWWEPRSGGFDIEDMKREGKTVPE
jgi:beta-glucuronidase